MINSITDSFIPDSFTADSLFANLMAIIRAALAEDVGSGDITSQLFIPDDLTAKMAFVAREKMVVCGIEIPELVYGEIDKSIVGKRIIVEKIAENGKEITAGELIATVSGSARSILTGERTSLNIMQRMSSVATITRKYVEAIAGTKAQIVDTRKTMPAMRFIDKYAVRVGGGVNHRIGLYDAVLIKDNHIAAAANILSEPLSLSAMIALARKNAPSLPVYIECDNLEQLQDALSAAPDRVLLDNMSPDMLRAAVKMAKNVQLEASGGVNLANVREIAESGVDFISVGALTHSALAVDIALDAL